MQIHNATVLPNTVTPFAGAKPGVQTAHVYTPSFPPIEQPSALDQARNSPSNPLVYTAKPANSKPQPAAGDKTEAHSTRSDGVDQRAETSEESGNALAPIGEQDSESRGQGEEQPGYSGLDEQELQEIQELVTRDREVRTHEQAHARVGGEYAGAPVYSYERGPDGISYATSGEVPIDVSPIPGDPQATIQKMRQVHRAALAPAEPSAQDRAVAATAARQLLEAQAELMRARVAEQEGTSAAREGENARANDKAEEAGRSGRSDFAVMLGIGTYRDMLERGRLLQEQGLRPRPLLDVMV